jgi:hypothetical protein
MNRRGYEVDSSLAGGDAWWFPMLCDVAIARMAFTCQVHLRYAMLRWQMRSQSGQERRITMHGRPFLFKTRCVTQPAKKVMHCDYPNIVNLHCHFPTVRCPFAGRQSYL